MGTAWISNAEIASAERLVFQTFLNPGSTGWDRSAIYFSTQPFAILRDDFALFLTKGATYDIFSTSFFDPFILRIQDISGNLLANDTNSIFVDYGMDVIWDFVAPYSGIYYVSASWDQGNFDRFVHLAIYEDLDTAFKSTPTAPALTSAVPALIPNVPLDTAVPPTATAPALTSAVPALIPIVPLDTAVAPAVIATPPSGQMISISRNGISSQEMAQPYVGPVSYLQHQYLGTQAGEVAIGTSGNDFINLLGGDDAANAGLGNDVIDGGTGSNFLSGGDGNDVFFLDGRGGLTTWATITDWRIGEEVVIWGWKPAISRAFSVELAGAQGYQGATLHADLDGNGQTDTSVTVSGIATFQIPTPLELDGLLWFI